MSEKEKKTICLGLLAHVDAGKTTLSESLLYEAGVIQTLGRVDHQTAYLDTEALERQRGITIFSKQARLSVADSEIVLMDTPGHVDFSAEMERVLQVLDYAVLVVSATDGIQGHTKTLWKLLAQYQVPTFLFLNKVDQLDEVSKDIFKEIKKQLSDYCIDFHSHQTGLETKEAWMENLAVCEESWMERYLEGNEISDEEIGQAVRQRRLFPCYYGSALRMDGVRELLDGIARYTISPVYPKEFGAKVYKIARDEQGNRLTYLKVTSGTLSVREVIEQLDEKVTQIRLYSGAKYQAVQQVHAGQVCAICGCTKTYPGQGLGCEKDSTGYTLQPVLTYRMYLPEGSDVHQSLLKLRELEEEEPQLQLVWKEELGEIHVCLMGEVQIEVLQSVILERFGLSVTFGEGNIVYKETIADTVEGVGHFEPLRHYAEVHLLLEPGERGSGLVFDTNCSEDELDRNWQNLILTHLAERVHRGVLIGAAITDMKITLIAGRAHQKHTEGGDFRQATYRAVRQGLYKAQSVLLEPWYRFRMELPRGCVGRAMSDLQQKAGKFEAPQIEGEVAILEGRVPVATMRGYQNEFRSYTGGLGQLSCQLAGYEVCHQAEEIIEAYGYDADADLEHPASSVFCSHGAGLVVKWDEVEEWMHVESPFAKQQKRQQEEDERTQVKPMQRIEREVAWTKEELAKIEVRTPDPIRRPKTIRPVTVEAPKEPHRVQLEGRPTKTSYLLVDGYNIIFAWEELKDLAKVNLDAARDALMEVMSHYQGYRGCEVILVFDAYKVKGNVEHVMRYHNIHVVYTKEAETADQYIEKTVRRMQRKYDVCVATSDALEQLIIMGQGATRLSAQGLLDEILEMKQEIRREYLDANKQEVEGRNYLFHGLDEAFAKQLEQIRLGKSGNN
jgi:small GTP-binding protein